MGSDHYQAVLTVFLTSFANFSTAGMVVGCFKGLVNEERNLIVARNVWRMMLSGVLVSLLSAGMVGLFVW
ncbi:nucleoside transporter C-terminal domain-containing protein [uncultured Actinomyces sp.]|uniref:nucleoside transporter C-terminal domain-containing protein n=1 Tax=uncultured Actinomyces sp. TaxID=249061 RepID=UPI0028E87D74|nr:nucleoside transporter C-terminal domain-containing protein [uncultured Actinomyces sp.]